MRYIKGNIVECDNCHAHVLIENRLADTFTAWNYNHTRYNRYLHCPHCNEDVFVENVKE